MRADCLPGVPLSDTVAMVTISGAGPGDPELLTVKAMRRLQQAGAVLYDSLVSEEILALASDTAELVHVGKRCGDGVDQTERQRMINELMLDYAQRGVHCMRLKAGDPFVFGSGVEEVRFLKEHGVPVDVIPGITAGIAAADLLHIPITERYRSSSVVFSTGHASDCSVDEFDALIALLKEGAPLVLYMGLKNLERIVERLLSSGFSPALPVSAVARVSMPDQQLLTGTLATICGIMHAEMPSTPVVFLMGEHAVPVSSLPITS